MRNDNCIEEPTSWGMIIALRSRPQVWISPGILGPSRYDPHCSDLAAPSARCRFTVTGLLNQFQRLEPVWLGRHILQNANSTCNNIRAAPHKTEFIHVFNIKNVFWEFPNLLIFYRRIKAPKNQVNNYDNVIPLRGMIIMLRDRPHEKSQLVKSLDGGAWDPLRASPSSPPSFSPSKKLSSKSYRQILKEEL